MLVVNKVAIIALGAATTMAAATVVHAAPAAAAPVVTCNGATYSVTLDPGLRLLGGDFTFGGGGQLTDCSSPSDPAVNGDATFTFSGSGNGGCLLGGSLAVASTIIWADGETTAGQGQITTRFILGLLPKVSVSGGMTSGKFAPATISSIPGPIAINPLGCILGSGITKVSGSSFTFSLIKA